MKIKNKKILITAYAATPHKAWTKLREESTKFRLCGWSFGNISRESFDHDTKQWKVEFEMLLEENK